MILNVHRLRQERLEKGLSKTASTIISESASARPDTKWDVFLSYSSLDKQALPEVVYRIRQEGLSVYVDRLADADLDPNNVTAETAARIRGRLQNSSALFVLTSHNSSASRWVPWELGFADGAGKHVAVLPIIKSAHADAFRFDGNEYLGLYPWIDEADDPQHDSRLWPTDPSDPNRYQELKAWLAGKPLVPH